MKIKDYAYPTMMAEKCLRLLHQAVLAGKMDEARDMARQTIVWTVEIQEALEVMSEAQSKHD